MSEKPMQGGGNGRRSIPWPAVALALTASLALIAGFTAVWTFVGYGDSVRALQIVTGELKELNKKQDDRLNALERQGDRLQELKTTMSDLKETIERRETRWIVDQKDARLQFQELREQLLRSGLLDGRGKR